MTTEQFTNNFVALRRWDLEIVRRVLSGTIDIAESSPLVAGAWKLASDLHKGRLRDDNEPYFNHCIRVRNNAIAIIANRQTFGTMGEDIKWLATADGLALASAAAYCHDNIEDGKDWKTEYDALSNLDFRLAIVVRTLSREKGESYYDFIYRIRDVNLWLAERSPKMERIPENLVLLGRIIKAADLQDNLKPDDHGSRADKYRFALDVIDPDREMRRRELK